MVMNLTLGALVVDCSGSMEPIANDVRGSIKQFISDQKKQEGSKALLTVSQFDHTYEVIHDLEEVEKIDAETFAKSYKPRGSTALLDAIGRATLDMQAKLDGMSEKPKRVVLAIITDGEENSSREFNIEKIKSMIKDKEDAGWDFVFLGASLDAIKVAEGMGISGAKASSYAMSNFKSCMNVLSEKFTQARLNKEVEFTQENREELGKTG